MKNRWQKSLAVAVTTFDTPLPWARGRKRAAMIARRSEDVETAAKSQKQA